MTQENQLGIKRSANTANEIAFKHSEREQISRIRSDPDREETLSLEYFPNLSSFKPMYFKRECRQSPSHLPFQTLKDIMSMTPRYARYAY